METVIAYLLIWGTAATLANKDFRKHMAKYGLDTDGHRIDNGKQFHRRFDD